MVIDATAQSAASAAKPLVAFDPSPTLVRSSQTGNEWRIGPLRLTTPTSWTFSFRVDGTFVTASDNARMSLGFVQATPDALAIGYSAILDPKRGPAQLRNHLEDACGEGSEPSFSELPAPSGRRVLVASQQCSTRSVDGPDYSIQYFIYSNRFIAMIHAMGTGTVREGHNLFTPILLSHGWDEEI